MEERRLGSGYLLDHQVGEGASGQVWLGSDRARRPRAVKLLRHELAHDAAVVQRFVQERSLLESIHHPNVVQVHDLVVEGGTLAIVMDYVDGPDLATVLAERGTLAPLEVAELGRQVAAALHATGWQEVYFARLQDLTTPLPDPEQEGRVFVVARKNSSNC